jgi:hypothetical protein
MLKYHKNIYSWEDEHIIEKKMVIFKKKTHAKTDIKNVQLNRFQNIMMEKGLTYG